MTKIYFVNYIIMTTITIDNCVYFVHPVYNLYASSEDGKIIHIIKKVPTNGSSRKKRLFYSKGKKT